MSSVFTYAYDSATKRPSNVTAFRTYLQNGMPAVQGVRYDETTKTIKVDLPYTITHSDKTILDNLVGAYDGYEPTGSVVEVRLQQEYIKTQGNYKVEGITISAPANTTTTSTFSWKYPTSVMATKVFVPPDNHGDVMHGKIVLPIPIGTTTAPASPGDHSVQVSPSVLEYINIGYTLKVSDGVNTDVLNEVCNIDAANNVVHVCTPFTHSFAAGSYVYFERMVVKNLVLCSGMHMTLGDATSGGIPLPANIPITVVYENRHNSDVSFTFYIEHLY